MNYKKSEIKEMSNEKLLSTFYSLGVEETKEINFGRGSITNKTLKARTWILEELSKRIDIDINIVEKDINI